MAASSLSMTLALSVRPKQMMSTTCPTNSIISLPLNNIRSNLKDNFSVKKSCYKRRTVLEAIGMLALSFAPTNSTLSQETPDKYTAFIDKADGYSYVYPSDWREFDFRAHDSAFKDRYLQLQNVRLSFIPTDKNDIHDLGPMEEMVPNLVNNILAAPSQVTYIKDIQERSIDGKNYCTFEYQLTSPNFSVIHFTTIAIANGRYYTLTVGANERRWKDSETNLKLWPIPSRCSISNTSTTLIIILLQRSSSIKLS
ncbi:Photosynthetic NDH subunit of lumenal location 1 chloroplastic [Bienertia sinuspersici]